uniref:Envelope protein Mab2 n=1 Tax=Mabuya sp. NRPS-2014 TaxID=1496371 RepID=A0A2H4RC07_9SAUR|nr:envelope protein Mab2 [Mabuya sp. NRPS-2014]
MCFSVATKLLMLIYVVGMYFPIVTANYFLKAHNLTYGDQTVCYPYGAALSVRSLWAAVPLSITDYIISEVTPPEWRPIEGEYRLALPGSCIGSQPGYEGCPEHTNLAYILITGPREPSSQCVPGCAQWNYTQPPHCTQEVYRCYKDDIHTQRYIEYNTSNWNWSLTEEELLTTPAIYGSDIWFHQQYHIQGSSQCLCQKGCIAINDLLFLKKNGQFANYHKGCESVALGVVKLHGIPCPSSYKQSPKVRNAREASYPSGSPLLSKDYCADKEMYVPSHAETIGVGIASFGISTSVRLAHYMDEASCAIVRIGSDTRDALKKLSSAMHALQIYAEQSRLALDFYFSGQGGVCKVIRPRSCLISLNETNIESDIVDINSVVEHVTHGTSPDWLSWLTNFGWLKSLLVLVSFIVSLMILFCCCIYLTPLCLQHIKPKPLPSLPAREYQAELLRSYPLSASFRVNQGGNCIPVS